MEARVLERWGAWIAGLEPDDVPADVRDAARLQVLDMAAAALAGQRSEEAACIATGLAGFAGGGRCTVLGSPTPVSPADATVANAAHSMAQDFDDIVWMGHTCHAAVFAPLAVAEHEGLLDGPRFLTAVVAANEVGGRLGASAFLGPLNGQMWTFVHLVAAAAGVSRLLELDARQTTHALAIALAQPPFALQPGFLAPSSKLLAASTPAATGLQAAYWARAGMTGHTGIVEDPKGFWSRFSWRPLPAMTGGLGTFWALRTLTVKTWPGCHYFQTACTALERILARSGPLAPEGVRAVHIDTTKLAIEATRFAGEYAPRGTHIAPVNVSFDLRITAAILLLAGRLTAREVEPSWLREHTPAIRALLPRITVSHDPALTLQVIQSARAVQAGRSSLDGVGAREVVDLVRRYRRAYRSELLTPRELLAWGRAVAARDRRPVHDGLRFPSRVLLEHTDGRSWTEQVDLPVAALGAPGMADAVEAKFRREAGRSLGPDAERALRCGRALATGGLGPFLQALKPRAAA